MNPGASWLHDELDTAARNVKAVHLQRLAALDCATPAVRSLGRLHCPFGVLRIQPRSRALFEPDDAGAAALIVPVCWPEFVDGLTHWPCIDLIALRIDRPTTWLWRTGTAYALGGHLLEQWQGEPVPIVATPIDWLRAGGDAVCVLDWNETSPVWPLLRLVNEIEVDDDLLGRRLLEALDRTAPRPKVKRIHRPAVQRGGSHHAA